MNEESILKLLPLEGYQPINAGRNVGRCRCYKCGDSRKKTKKRLNFYSNNNKIHAYCFNCGFTSSLKNIIKQDFPEYINDYLAYHFDNINISAEEVKIDIVVEKQRYNILDDIKPLSTLPLYDKRVQYCISRKIELHQLNYIYYSDDFQVVAKKFADRIIERDNDVIIFVAMENNQATYIQSRSISNDDKRRRFITLENKYEIGHKIYGLDKINKNESIFVTEGIIDSLMIDNCVASIGTISNLSLLESVLPKENIVIVPDNDYKNKETDKFITNAIRDGFNIFIWPKDIKYKDVNQLIIEGGISKNEVKQMINDNIYNGQLALTKHILNTKTLN